jgi:hypothetical protein
MIILLFSGFARLAGTAIRVTLPQPVSLARGGPGRYNSVMLHGPQTTKNPFSNDS